MSTEKRKIAKAAGIVSALTLFSRITGLGRDIVISYLFGAGVAAEAFFVAFRLPNLFRRLVAEGAMSVAFVPVFSDMLAKRSRAEVEEGVRAITGVAVLVLVALASAGAVFAPYWIDLVAPGFADDPELRQLTVELTRWLFPYLVFIGLVAVFAGFLNASRHFVAPALSPALLNLAIIGSSVSLYAVLDVPVMALACGVLIGGACQLSLQVMALRRHGIAPLPIWRPASEAVRRVARLLAPATLGTAIFQVNVLIGTMLASFLDVGSVSYLWYADRVFEFPLGLFVAALGTAALPSMASQASRGEYTELGDSLAFALSLMNLVAIPATVGLILLAEPITAILFERGAFGARETILTAGALRFYAVGLWSVAVVRLLAPAFYALGDARTPVRVACLAVAVNILGGMMLMGEVADRTSPSWLIGAINSISLFDLDHRGLALATSIAAAVNAAALAILLARRLGGAFDRAVVVGSLWRSIVAAVPMALVVYGASVWLAPWLGSGLMVRGLTLFGIIATGVAVFIGAAHLLGTTEIERARRLLVDRLARRRG